MLLLQNHGMLMGAFCRSAAGHRRPVHQIGAGANPSALWRGRPICPSHRTNPPTRLGEMFREPAGVAELLLGDGSEPITMKPRPMAAPGAGGSAVYR